MSTFDASLHPRGHSSNAGAFTGREHTAPEATLAPSTRDWGVVNLEIGSRTPWGPADHVEQPAPGIAIAGTPSHGGMKLSAARNRAIPAPLRRLGGWYEEDCEAHIVGMYFPDAFPRRSPESSRDGVVRWFPDAYEEATGETLLPGQSPQRDRDIWDTAHVDDLVVTSARTDPDQPGQVLVTARRASDKQESVFRVPKAEYDSLRTSDELGRHGRFVVDPTQFEEIPQEPKPEPVPAVRHHSLPVGNTNAARTAIEKDLDRRWRTHDGRVRTLRQILTEEGVSGRTVLVENGKRRFYLEQQMHADSSSAVILQVSKATWAGIGDAPDTRSRATVLEQDRDIAEHALDAFRATHSRNWDEERKLGARLGAADEALRNHIANRDAGE
ncbi:DUF7007 domain-containing protein [Rathayibacter iranicus]|uniref:DUF7007 domain-containing protein n=2 Tax=Rathayibacter iranicus TaxID=59737 RepID=A0AAD2PTT8_9MICO|nr:hypothetical protein [Rathayibacter iranicus]AZZ54889.1 hypothetical protein C7V51_02585 [Rathayibacter iranicus]MWV31469.1 hypothetical protein [Rathayibacter iranicus NCPPB 2253 = VKM Ac-1602]PPI62513.1 hypothetical protein C5E08_02610 [Rathayibacter iranicus]PWJ61002.1 hypothetical protein B0H03_1218 [Rathayibacter iranicus NCPPB 2253 = VKM Ac-1602]